MDDMAPPSIVTPSVAAAPGDHRPPFWRWVKLSEREVRPLATDLKVSHNTVHRLMLPWDHDQRLVPGADLRARIEALTQGAVRADRDWTPPDVLDGTAQQDQWAG